jgi:hypothetical protein
MTRIRLSAGKKALAVLASIASGASLVYGCIPSVDTSGLPPYDGSVAPGFDANALNTVDGGEDAPFNEDAPTTDAPPNDAPPTTGTITGVVINYAQGNGLGVAPGATVSVGGTAFTTTTNAFGAFTLTGVPTGQVLLNVSKPTDQVDGVAYSATQAVLTLGGGQSVSVFPVIHQGCYENVASIGVAGSVSTTDTAAKCGALQSDADVFAELAWGVGAFTDPATGSAYNAAARVELIPIAFPQTPSATTDFTWGLGLPGASSPIETIGAVEIRVVATSTGADGGTIDSDLLTVTAANTSVTSTLNTWELANTTTYQPYLFDQTQGKWLPDTSGATLANAKLVSGVTPYDEVAITKLDRLGWLGITNPSTQTTCVTGSLTAGGAPATNVWVHATGLNYFGTSSTVTDSNGAFCLDVKAAGGADAGATPQIGIAAGFASTSGAFATSPSQGGFQVSSLGGGTCATQTGCTALGAIALQPFNSTCTNGTVTSTGNAPPPTLNVELEGLNISADQQADGILPAAYIGTTTLDDAGAFCAQAGAGTSIALVNPSAANCATSLITVSSTTAATCGGTSCSSAGSVAYTCKVAPPP